MCTSSIFLADDTGMWNHLIRQINYTIVALNDNPLKSPSIMFRDVDIVRAVQPTFSDHRIKTFASIRAAPSILSSSLFPLQHLMSMFEGALRRHHAAI